MSKTFKYLIVDYDLIKKNDFGFCIFCDRSILGIIKARSRVQALKLAKEITKKDNLHAIANGSRQFTKADLEIAETKGILGEAPPANNDRGAGRKNYNKKVAKVEVRLSQEAYDFLNSQLNKARFVAELIEASIKPTKILPATNKKIPARAKTEIYRDPNSN